MPLPTRYPPGVNPYAPSTSSKTPRTGHRPHPPAKPPKALLDDVDIEDFHPPEWRTVLNSRVDLGYPDFYPSRPGFDQPEDVLTEENVKNGFTGRNFIAVGAEVFSMHGPIHNHLSSGGLNLLQNLGKELIEKRQEMMPKIGERSFRIPVRVTYNDTKRLQFLNDLANPNVPLYKLMRTPVPHGFKGIELLDSMFSPNIGPSASGHNRTPSGSSNNNKIPSNPIPLDRALWFIRVLGSNEISAHRSRTQPQHHQTASANPNTPVGVSPAAAATPSSTTTIITAPTLQVSSNDWYTQEFTNTFISWLRVQLGQLALPNINAKSTVKPGVPPPKTLGGTLGDEKLRSRWLTKWEYSTQLMRELHRRRLLSSRLLSGWMADYLGYANLAQLGFVVQMIGEYLGDMVEHVCNARQCVRNACEKLKEIRSSPASDPLAKVDAMLTSVIKKLDSICEDTNMLELTRSFFDGGSSATNSSPDISRLEDKIFILLNWAMGLFQLGSHRPYAVYTLLKLWHDQHEEHQAKQAEPIVIDLFPLLYKWLDTSSAARKEENVQAIGITIGEITRQGMFSYGRYLQALIAKGQTARNHIPGQPQSHHLALLRALPIFVIAKDLVQQRRIALCGDDVDNRMRDDAVETALMDQFREEVMEYVPEVFGEIIYKNSAALRNVIDYQIPCSTKMSRYLYVQARFWLAPEAGRYLKGDSQTPPMDASTFARIMQVFRTCRGYATIADFIIRALQDSEDEEILDVIIDIVRRDADVWTAMDGWSRLGDKLLDRYHTLQTQGRHHLRTLQLLEYLVEKGRLTADEEDEVKHIRSEIPKDTPPKLEFKESLHSLQQVLSGAKEDHAIALAPKLFVRHGSFSNWSNQWWSTIIQHLQHPSSHVSQDSTLRTIDSHILAVRRDAQNQLEPVISSWLDGLTPTALVDMFGKRSGGLISPLLLELAVERCVSTLTLLEKLIYPIWKYTSSIILTPRRRLSSKQINAVNNTINMASQLLVSPPLIATLPPTIPTHSLIVLAFRQAVFCGVSVQNLIKHLPLLVVLLKSAMLSENTNSTISSLLRCLAMTAEFKTAAFRNLNILKDTFLSTEWSKPSSAHGLEAGMEDTLKLIMSEKQPNSSTPASKSRVTTFDNTARLSAWRWTRIVLEMRSDFKGLATRINNGEDVIEARQILHRQVLATLDRAATADDTDLLCEAFRGMDSVVTQEILVAGLDRLSNLLSQAIGAETQNHLEEHIKSIEQILRILDSTYTQRSSEPINDNTVLSSRHRLLDLLAVGLQSVERQLSDSDLVLHHDISTPPQPGHLLKTILDLLKFTLGLLVLDSNSPTTPKPNFPNLAVAFFRVMLSCHNVLDDEGAQMMSDMLSYIIDSTPSQSKISVQTALLSETVSSTTQDILSFKPILGKSLPYLPPTKRNMALLSTSADEDNLDSAVMMEERKWELFQQINPIPKKPNHQDLYLLNKPTVKDTSSISLGLFGPKFTRDVLPNLANRWQDPASGTAAAEGGAEEEEQDEEEEGNLPWENYASERTLGDGMNESPFERQKSTLLFDNAEELSLADQNGIEEDEVEYPRSGSISASVGTVKRRMSTRSQSSPTKPLAHLPKRGGQGGTNKDPISIDEDSSASGSNSDSDDSTSSEEVLEVQKPAAKKPRTSSTSTGGKRPATAGKAPARKSVGGKSVARKNTGGKSTRGTGGKAPRGRRKSSLVD
uniref:Mediator of RNA polymerase II transcription subunit 12 n=1 Tax=Kwoniella bestiolae CBS 10118 TaxID=1296100 RepID=A0A1B9G4N3_9TREE|nr:hypothetical protein I302_03671 [Kwoniella bestiolae CBS 10118]OCF25994.1 hypothetical protein I302_03671 [Kwoniella bestiolae CBS 10118]